ncbi:MAG: BrnT family toxin [Rhodospirillaceae bacterium]|jgi:uncharacterized protein|nr:BrnT family toxin [Rhodospirillaceae bacterium]MBT5666583.1 BrnT family toxin [Rhodospirillaceae bacterium]MBT5809282.1 BrnT family toxin [Rhodospirillaceae bacterium]
MSFEWDENKRESNLLKHGIDFVRAAKMFSNPILERRDGRENYGEDRWVAIGRWETSYMVVIYTWRNDNRRLISAWKAGKNEQEEYQNRISG